MNKSSDNPQEPLRAFVAFDISAAMRRELTRVQEDLRERLEGDISWVKPENIHLSLRFLGTITPRQVEQAKIILQEVAKINNRFTVDLGTVNAFPHTHNPRVIWVGIKTGFNELNQINGHLEEKLSHTGFTSDDRAFYPHLSLARVKQLKNRATFSACIDEITPRFVSTSIERISLFKSTLQPGGPVYTLLAESPLK